MCAKVAGLVLKVLSDLLGHENHEVLRQCCLPWVDWGTVMVTWVLVTFQARGWLWAGAVFNVYSSMYLRVLCVCVCLSV